MILVGLYYCFLSEISRICEYPFDDTHNPHELVELKNGIKIFISRVNLAEPMFREWRNV